MEFHRLLGYKGQMGVKAEAEEYGTT